jgi:hypothetical protein
MREQSFPAVMTSPIGQAEDVLGTVIKQCTRDFKSRYKRPNVFARGRLAFEMPPERILELCGKVLGCAAVTAQIPWATGVKKRACSAWMVIYCYCNATPTVAHGGQTTRVCLLGATHK